MNQNEIKQLAAEGLRQKIQQKVEELEKLRDQLALLVGRPDQLTKNLKKPKPKSGKPKKPARKMSTANKKRISERMKSYWAKRRGEATNAEIAASVASGEDVQTVFEPAGD